ncbi:MULTISPECIES: gamma-glutamylcyclotransferase family protein [unclassified Aureimonas]|uniref:gamma-glutamylcyclotransferase family protein n=1 Tax=unclassified Aureimonas TaxID=2615206 RepID=UPI0006FA993D|nr:MULTISPECIES: gamma-glutamylcyclotransferase family protein [unclassified Aureimonas]KQT57391.1 hypothetical protein ASG62_08680 [Aureimonas sp. Leaf427]KQT77069.1 hypothetical protein ASG54_12545 [Aureimonas sp. Leaf460]
MAEPIHADHPDFARFAAEGSVVAYFGYGSLVNKATLRTRFLAIRRAEVVGWRRFWLPRPAPYAAYLSVRPEPGHPTQGVVVYDLAENLPLVDEREAGYRRVAVDGGEVFVEGAPDVEVPLFLYEALRPEETAAEAGCFLLQSYLDAVLQGFLALYGEEGLRRFVGETEGFETDIVADRHAPRYPRSVTLGSGEAELFDRLIETRGARFVQSSGEWL